MALRLRLCVVALAALTVAACGATTRPKTHVARGVSPADMRVVVGWAKALRAGEIETAARYFRIPSVFFDGSSAPVQLRSLGQAEAVNAALPCGAVFVSARVSGSYIDVLFRLTNRDGPGGGGCGAGVGQTARTNVLIRHGHIAAWLRAPDEPGDNGTPRTTPTPPGTQTAAPAQV